MVAQMPIVLSVMVKYLDWHLRVDIISSMTNKRKLSTSEFLKEYCERMKDHVPSAEERYEMRAAFGEGQTVVNVITGKKYTT